MNNRLVTRMETRRSRAKALLLIGLFCATSASVAISAENPPEKPRENSLTFGTDIARDSHAIEMRKRLGDPALRQVLRAETRDTVRSSNPDLAEVLGLDASVADKLLDVLTDQQMSHLDWFYTLAFQQPSNASSPDRVADDRDTIEIRNRQQIQNLLGEERYDQYVDYTGTLTERRAVAYLSAHLDTANQLTADQKTRLIELLHVHQEESFARNRGVLRNVSLPVLPASKEELNRQLQKQNIAVHEQSYRDMQDDSRQLLERLPAVLTPRQLEVYAGLEAEKLAGQLKHVQALRVRSGLSPELDPPPESDGRSERLVSGSVRVQLSVRINGSEPVVLKVLAENGKAAAAFEAAPGLWIEPTPMLFEDGSASVGLQFQEESRGKRRALRSGMSVYMPSSLVNRSVPRPLSGSGMSTVVSGSKVYAVGVDADVTPLF